MMKRPGNRRRTECCAPKPPLAQRALIGPRQAAELGRLFKILANDTRLQLLHALARAGESSVTQLADTLGMKVQAVSNQLRRLADRGIVVPRRNGLQICYRIVDPCVVALLDRAWCLAEDSETRSPQRFGVARAAFRRHRRE
jgi:ArsR family transcriptional regulator, lead/cadmium/zinc/bismuth-responsive transcriptional repressor